MAQKHHPVWPEANACRVSPAILYRGERDWPVSAGRVCETGSDAAVCVFVTLPQSPGNAQNPA